MPCEEGKLFGLVVGPGGCVDGGGCLGKMSDRRLGGWVDRLTQAIFPWGSLLIGNDQKVLARCHLI